MPLVVITLDVIVVFLSFLNLVPNMVINSALNFLNDIFWADVLRKLLAMAEHNHPISDVQIDL